MTAIEAYRDGDRDAVCDRFEREVLPTLDVSMLKGSIWSAGVRRSDVMRSCARPTLNCSVRTQHDGCGLKPESPRSCPGHPPVEAQRIAATAVSCH
jgi:hypothetical protein